MSFSWTVLLAFLLLFVEGIDSAKLTGLQNAALQQSCGRSMKLGHYSRKVLNGTAARAGEVPFAVALYITDHQGKTVYTSGTLISDRHVLSYDSLFLVNSTNGIMLRHNMTPIGTQQCEGQDLILPKHLVRRVSAFLRMLRADRYKGNRQLQVRKITILGGCQTPFSLNRVSVIELTRPVPETDDVKPICIPFSEFPYTLTFYGFGDNRGNVKDATLRHTKINLVPCPNFDPQFSTFCARAQNPLCNGDFGGAAVRKVDGHVEAFGIYIEGPYECDKADGQTVFRFANLTTYAKSICEVAGVCDESLLPASTTMPSGTDDTVDIYGRSTPVHGDPRATTEATGSSTRNPDFDPSQEGAEDFTEATEDAYTRRPGSVDVGYTTQSTGAIEDSYTRLEDATEDSYTRLADATEDSYTRLPDATEDSYTRLPDAIEDAFTRLPDATEDSFTRLPDATADATGSPIGTGATVRTCFDMAEGDIHIHIALAKYLKTRDTHDIVQLIKGPISRITM